MGADEEPSPSAAAKAEAALAAAIHGGGGGGKKDPPPSAPAAGGGGAKDPPEGKEGVFADNNNAGKPNPTTTSSTAEKKETFPTITKRLPIAERLLRISQASAQVSARGLIPLPAHLQGPTTTSSAVAEKEETFAESATRAAIAAAAGGGGYFDGDDDDDEDDEPEWAGDMEDDSDDDEGEAAVVDPVILNGTIHLNDEGRVIYSGTWCLQSELSKEGKKHPKFKLKSQDTCIAPPQSSSDDGDNKEGKEANNDGDGKDDDAGAEKSQSNKPLFDVRCPTKAKLEPIPTERRKMIFDGFFFEPLPAANSADLKPAAEENGHRKHHHHHHHGKKVKERDVEIFFTTATDEGIDPTTNQKFATVGYRISGRGYNEYGPFVLNGTYGTYDAIKKSIVSVDKNGKVCAAVKCEKTYGSGGGDAKDTSGGAAKGSGGGAAKRSRRYQEEDDDSFDDDFADEKADYGEINDLCEDAALSVEELRRKYYGGGGGGGDEEEGGGKMAPAKRARLEESDDDECGF